MNEDEKNLAEYKEACAEERLNAGLLFGQMTVYLVAMGGLLQIAASKPTLWVLPLLGMFVSLAFFVIGERCGDFAHAARERAKNIEPLLGFALYTSAPKAKIPWATRINATRIVFVGGFTGWLITGLLHWLPCLFTYQN